ncbi:Cadherin-like protein [Sarocladium implicatum]|nr:Cadherin-like protein [Sarocladium implicatum]
MAALRPFGLVLASQLLHFASSEPQISFPLNSQLPPAARIDSLFSYVFSEYTFRSDSNITYSLGDHPEWLSLDEDERRLYGIPEDKNVPSGEVVGQTVEIVATDETGSTAMNSTLVVTRRTAPSITKPLSQQIEAFGQYSAPSTLLAYTSTEFSYTFAPNTFSSGSLGASYYATSGDGSPLPAWIKFDDQTLTFSGTTPPLEALVSPPQNFSFQLIASDIVGFSAESLEFSIMVGSHLLTTEQPILELNATRGSKFSYDKLGEGIKLDGKPISSNELNAKTDGIPEWLSFDTKTLKLEGTPKRGDRSTNFTITLSDTFTDKLDIIVMLNVATGLFKSTFEDIEAEPGETIDLDLQDHLRDPQDVNIEVSTSPEQDWLKVDGLVISGLVPKSAKGNFKVSIKASSKSEDMSETEALNVAFLALDGTTTTQTSSSATATSTETDDGAGKGHDEDHKGPGHLPLSAILTATLVPIFSIALILLAIFLLMRRRRRAKETYLNNAYRRNISNPLPDTLIVNGPDPSNPGAREKLPKMGPDGAFITTDTFYDPKKGNAAADRLRRSSSLSSDTSAATTVDLNPPSIAMAAGGARPPSVRNISQPSTSSGDDSGSRRSWVTVEEGRADKSRSNLVGEAITAPARVEHHVHYPGNQTFRSGIDVVIPSLDDLSILPEVMSPGAQAHGQRNFDTLSVASSDVLPASRMASFNLSTVLKRGFSSQPATNNSNTNSVNRNFLHSNHASDARPSTAPADSDDPSRDSVTELKTPGAVVVRTNSMAKRMSGLGNRSSTFTGSFLTDTSYASGENWRVHGSLRRGASVSSRPVPALGVGPSYHELVEDAPFNPARPTTSGGQEAAGESSKSGENWRRDDSALTEGSKGSYSVFL